MHEKHRIALLKACRIVGGQKQLAQRIKVNPSRLNKWINRNKGTVPYQFALDIENATLGQVTCYELVPKWEKVVEHCKRNKEEVNDIPPVFHVNNLTTDGVSENTNPPDSIQDQDDKKSII
jgi:DNA-binding transcriptional regulator YdaS (Cro superfamily)